MKRAPIAQLVEQIPLKDKVAGPSPAGGTIDIFLKKDKIKLYGETIYSNL